MRTDGMSDPLRWRRVITDPLTGEVHYEEPGPKEDSDLWWDYVAYHESGCRDEDRHKAQSEEQCVDRLAEELDDVM